MGVYGLITVYILNRVYFEYIHITGVVYLTPSSISSHLGNWERYYSRLGNGTIGNWEGSCRHWERVLLRDPR